MAPRRASAPLARASSVEMGASWWVEGQRLGGVGSVAAAVDHVFVRAKEKSKTVSGGEGRGRLGPKEEVEDVGEKGNGWRTRAPGGKVGSAERRVGGGVSLGRGRAIPPLSWARGGKKKGQAEGQLVCSSNGLDFLGVIDQRPREMLRVHSLKAALGEIGREVSLEAWRGSWASGIGDHSRFGDPAPCLVVFSSRAWEHGVGVWKGMVGLVILFYFFRVKRLSRENVRPGDGK